MPIRLLFSPKAGQAMQRKSSCTALVPLVHHLASNRRLSPAAVLLLQVLRIQGKCNSLQGTLSGRSQRMRPSVLSPRHGQLAAVQHRQRYANKAYFSSEVSPFPTPNSNKKGRFINMHLVIEHVHSKRRMRNFASSCMCYC